MPPVLNITKHVGQKHQALLGDDVPDDMPSSSHPRMRLQHKAIVPEQKRLRR
jgi:hypothetical protein